ncbi:hypothetical protein V5799_006629 [Amblyomma americanum]|uniref:Transmembrane protein n=1 Tax=Amblyomma americanum TaxID=6943 RepID=A0AAQ4DVV1_AMBAM
MGLETADSLASLLPRKNSELSLRGCPRNVIVALCSGAFVVGLASAAALFVFAERNRSLESSYESAPPAIVFPAARLGLFEQPTRDVPRSTARERVRRITQAAPYLVERNDRWRLVRVTRSHRRLRPVLGATAGVLSRRINVASSETPLMSRGNDVLEEKIKNPPFKVGGSVKTSAAGGDSGTRERSLQFGSGSIEAKKSSAAAVVVHQSPITATGSTLIASEKPSPLMPGAAPAARKTAGVKGGHFIFSDVTEILKEDWE